MGSIKLGNTSVNSIYLGSTEVKKVYLGSTLIWEKDSGGGGGEIDYYQHSWSVTIYNNSSLDSGFFGEDGGLYIYDEDGNDVAEESVLIPLLGQSTHVDFDFGYTCEQINSKVYTVVLKYHNAEIFTDSVTFTWHPENNSFMGSPQDIHFDFN